MDGPQPQRNCFSGTFFPTEGFTVQAHPLFVRSLVLNQKNPIVIVPAKKMNCDLRTLHPTSSCDWEFTGETEQPVFLLFFDDLAIVGVKPELTYATDQQIKKASIFPHTLVATLVNGGAKYMPEQDAYIQYRYEALNSPFAPGAAERLALAAEQLLKQGGCGMSSVKWIDFSCKSHILLEDRNGERVPMSEPFFQSREIAPIPGKFYRMEIILICWKGRKATRC